MQAVILFSGGLDSTVALAMALKQKRKCLALSFDYGQRHRVELKAAADIAAYYNIPHKIIRIDRTCFGKSSLVDLQSVPKNRNREAILSDSTPSTYVPARNTIFLAFAMGQAEIYEAREIWVGFNAMDAGGYPDCRKSYLDAMQSVLNIATRSALESEPQVIVAPFLSMDKQQILNEGAKLEAPIEMTWSCYDPTVEDTPCGCCDACILRGGSITRLQ